MKIFSTHCKRTDFLRLQVESLKYFCLDPFEYYCIDNFVDSSQSEFIREECKSLGVNYVRYDNYSITGTAWDHAPALNSIKTTADDDDIVVILDFDVFMISKFSFIDYILDYDVSGIYAQRENFEKEYICPFVVIINKNISQIDFTGCDGCDVGGNTRYYIKNKKIKWMKHTSYLNRDSDIEAFNFNYDPKYHSQIIESSFLHYYRGSNWDNNAVDFHHIKTEWLKSLIRQSKKSIVLNQKYLDKFQTVFSFSFQNWNGIDNNYYNSQLNPFLNI